MSHTSFLRSHSGKKPVSARKRLLTMLVVLTLMVTQTVMPSKAFATAEDIFAEADELQLIVEKTAEEYNAAVAALTALEDQIAELQKRIDELEEILPVQKERSSAAMNDYYRMYTSSNLFLELIFGARSFGDLLASYEYAIRLQNSCMNELVRTKEMVAELLEAREQLEQNRQDALAEKNHVEQALAEARAAREEKLRLAEEVRQQELEEIRRLAAEARKQALENQINEDGPTPIDWIDDRAAFVAEWAPRIDRYLAGFPLAGYGWVFAEAAYDYNVDPRWSPAISCTESTKGKYCFRDHNSWGWGYVNWPDWETAIRAHVKGLANGYGYTISIWAAKKYCPPSWEHWYIVTASEMERI